VDESSSKASIEVAYGHFSEIGGFISSREELGSDSFEYNLENDVYKSYLKVTLSNENSLLLNNGPFDNRSIIAPKNSTENDIGMTVGSKWFLQLQAFDANGDSSNSLNCSISEYVYNTENFGYSSVTSNNITLEHEDGDPANVLTVTSSTYTEKTFKNNSQLRIVITGDPGTYYI
jgi:hypothetical protein